MNLTNTQLSNLLDAFPYPVQIIDADGEIVAQNQVAAGQTGYSFFVTEPLGNGVLLRRLAGGALVGKHGMDTLARELMHEVRNPLSAVMTAARLLRSDSGLDEETQLLLGIVAEEAVRINRILNDFSTYLKLPGAQPANLDVAQLARRLVAQLQREGHISDDVEVCDELPESLPALADEVLLDYALTSVLRNAGEAIAAEGTIRLVGQSTPQPILCIEDTGSGFTKESLANAFTPFFSTRSKHTGLGLPVARAAIELSGGRIWAENRQENSAGNTGARICLQLPALESTLPLKDVAARD